MERILPPHLRLIACLGAASILILPSCRSQEPNEEEPPTLSYPDAPEPPDDPAPAPPLDIDSIPVEKVKDTLPEEPLKSDLRIAYPIRALIQDVQKEPIQPIPSIPDFFEDMEIDYNPEIIELGRVLFHDPRLSKDNSISCASCHDLRYAGVDRSRSAVGFDHQVGEINSPTVFNSAFGISQFWDGRAETLEDQAKTPVTNPKEMSSSWTDILQKLRADRIMVDRFQSAFPEEIEIEEDITTEHILVSVSDFERTLLTPDSPFDRFLKGDKEAITDDEYAGYVLFKEFGCSECHYGPAVGGKTYQPLGAKKKFFVDLNVAKIHLGRFNVTQDERDRFVFKVPMLRNVALTAPYFHDGSQETLEDAVRTMGLYQVGDDLTDREIELLLIFLRSLTGKYRGIPLDAFPPHEEKEVR